MEGIVYKVVNQYNNNIYVGVTTTSVAQRRKKHYEDSKKGIDRKFYNALTTYNPDTFIWEQIDTASSNDELAKKEKNYILKYNSKENSYNSDVGGGIRKTVYKYDLKGAFIEKYDCLKNASATVGASKQQISRACLTNKEYKSFYWSYDYVDKLTPNKEDKRKKNVLQMSLDGDFIAEYNSVSKASDITGFNKSSIAKVCRGERKQCQGYLWRYK